MSIIADDLNRALTSDRAGILRWLNATLRKSRGRTHDAAPLLTLSTNWHGMWMHTTKVKLPTHTKGNHD